MGSDGGVREEVAFGVEELGFSPTIGCSDTFSRRAACAILVSPANTLNTIRGFYSTGILGGLPKIKTLLQD